MKLAVYGICKNEMKFLDKWLENIKDADYICIMDTGSTDGSYEKLLEKQAENPEKYIIAQKEINPWRFDVARNESMKLVPEDTDIYLCVDMDELFTTPNFIEIIKSKWQLGKTHRGHYNYAWSHNAIGECQDIFKYDKLHTKDYHWKFAVHEVLWPNDYMFEIAGKAFKEEVIDYDILLEHFPDKTKSRKFYFDLLELAVSENQEDPHIRMLLAREYLLNKDYDKALEHYLATLKLPAIDLPEFKQVLIESLGRCADIYAVQKNYDEAIWYCQEWIKEDRTYREPYFIMAELYNDMKMYTLAEAMCKAGFEYGTRKYSWVERATTWLGWGYDVLSISCSNLNKFKEALKAVDGALKHDPNNVRLLKNKIAILTNLK